MSSQPCLIILGILVVLNKAVSGHWMTTPQREPVTTQVDPVVTTQEMLTTTIPSICGACQPHPQQHFCVDKAVAKVKVLKKISDDTYKVTILRVFKGPKSLLSQTELVSFNKCPAPITERTTYIISGEINEDGSYFRTTHCHWVQEFSKLTRRQRIGLRNPYKEGCAKCQIEPCYWKGCEKTNPKVCFFEADWNVATSKCYTENSYCKQKGDTCKWISREIVFTDEGRQSRRVNCNK